MRTAFIEALTEVAARDARVWLLTGDLGYSVVEDFAARFPERFLNVGVAEQNMTGVAAGLALAGHVVFTYSIANFPVMRCLEQIRNDVCYHDLDVKIVAVGGGLAYGSLGYSHHALEDLAVTRVLPNMTVLAPGDPHETRAAVDLLVRTPGPAYLRLGKAGEPNVHSAEVTLEYGRTLSVREGQDVALLSTGGMLDTAVRLADRLADFGILASVLSVPFVRPLDDAAIGDVARRTGAVVTLEEHGPGGLGSAVAERLLEAGIACRFRALRPQGDVLSVAGSHDDLRALAGLSVPRLVEDVRAWLRTPDSNDG